MKRINYKLENFDKLSASLLAEILHKLLKDNKSINVALSGGSTPLPILKILSKNKSIAWEKINFYLVDERCVPVNSSHSNYKNINDNFFKKIESKNFKIIKENIDFKKCSENYNNLINNQVKTINDFPCFDLVLLGIGNDGHIASLFPNSSALKEIKKTATLNYVSKLKSYRITLTYPTILNSKEIILISKGKEKEMLINSLVSSKTDYPIQKIFDEYKNLTIVTTCS